MVTHDLEAATLAGLGIALVSDAAVSTAAGLPLLFGFSVASAAAIAAFGFLLLAFATTVPTVMALAGSRRVPFGPKAV